MGRAQGQRQAVTVTGFDRLLGARRGRRPGDPDVTDDEITESTPAETVGQLRTAITGSDASSPERHRALDNALTHLNTIEPDSDEFTVLLAATVHGLQQRVHWGEEDTCIKYVQHIFDSSIKTAHCGPYIAQRCEKILGKQLLAQRTDGQQLELYATLKNAQFAYRNACAQELSLELNQAADDGAQLVRQVLGDDLYKKTQRTGGSFLKRPDLETLMNRERWERVLRDRDPNEGRVGFQNELISQLNRVMPT